jgi:F-type H+-transporting ATPase subunit delta
MTAGGSLARRYARALLDIGREDGQAHRILDEVETLTEVLVSSPVLREAMEAVHINRRDKHMALEAAVNPLGFLPATVHFLQLLIDKGRMKVLPQILSELRRMVERMEGIERVEVVVPMPLAAAQREALKAALARRTGKTIEVEEAVDPTLLGGMVVKVGSTVYDGSIRTQIRQIRETMQKG